MTVYGQLNVRNINEVGKTLIIIINNIKIAININIELTNMNSNIIQVDDSKMVISLEVSLR